MLKAPSLMFIPFCLLLTACNLTEEEKEKLDEASQNLEKVVLKPIILAPSENQTVRDTTAVLFEIDDTSTEYQSISLKVDGVEVSSISEAPYQFQWDPYYSSERNTASLLIRAVTSDATLLLSEVVTVSVDQTIKDQVQILSPYQGEIIQNTDSLNIVIGGKDNAESYDLKLSINGNAEEFTTISPTTQLSLNTLGAYSLEVRAVDQFGRKGGWTSPREFTLAAPSAPVIASIETDQEENDWNISAEFSGLLTESTVQVATDQEFNNILHEEALTESNQFDLSVPAGIYYIRAKTINQFDISSNWSNISEIAPGMFAAQNNIASTGWELDDVPVDFIVEDDAFIIASKRGDMNDASGDDFSIVKMSPAGDNIWSKSFHAEFRAPKTIKASEGGYILSAEGFHFRDTGLLLIDGEGNKVWSESFNHQESEGGEFGFGSVTSEQIEDAVFVEPDRYVAVGISKLCHYTEEKNSWGFANYRCDSDPSVLAGNIANGEVITAIEIDQPDAGEFTHLASVILSGNSVLGVGGYKAPNSSGGVSGDGTGDDFIPHVSSNGAFLVDIHSNSGTVAEPVVLPGVNSSPDNLIETNGNNVVTTFRDQYVGAVSSYNVETLLKGTQLTSGIQNAKVAADLQNGGYVLVAHSRYGNYPRPVYLYRFTESHQQVGDRLDLKGCYRNFKLVELKSHPKYGVVVLGTADMGLSTDDSYTVVFNLSEDLQHLCPVN